MSDMKVVPFIYDKPYDLLSNTYLVIDNNNQCIVIDPSCDYDGIINYICKNQLVMKGVFLTHTHFDHIKGADRICDYFDVPLFVNELDVPGLTDDKINCSFYIKKPLLVKKVPTSFTDGETFNLLDEQILAIHTPFHTIGSTCFYIEKSNILFSGDTLFKNGIGRTDLPTGKKSMIEASLAKIFALPGDIKVYPGHGPSTVICDEKNRNLF